MLKLIEKENHELHLNRSIIDGFILSIKPMIQKLNEVKQRRLLSLLRNDPQGFDQIRQK